MCLLGADSLTVNLMIVEPALPSEIATSSTESELIVTSEIGTAQSSVPIDGSKAAKYTNFPEATTPSGSELAGPGAMSWINEVVASVPVVHHGSRPFALVWALKRREPPTLTRFWGDEEPDPGSMSFTRTVPRVVPSLFHSSWPLMPSDAEKNRLSPTTVSASGNDDHPGRGSISFTICVPATVPSLLHSSRPARPSSAVKKSRPRKLTRS